MEISGGVKITKVDHAGVKVGSELDVNVTAPSTFYLVVKIPLAVRPAGAVGPFTLDHAGVVLAACLTEVLDRPRGRQVAEVLRKADEMAPREPAPVQ